MHALLRILIALGGGLAVIAALIAALALLTSREPPSLQRRGANAALLGDLAQSSEWWRGDYEVVGDGVIVPIDSAPSLLRQCSRATVSPIDGYWRPTPRMVQQFEAQLPTLFQRPAAEQPPPSERYLRQYAGVVSRGRPMIYASFLPPDVWAHADWQSNVVTYCGGGSRYWGVAFDVQAESFSDLAFNSQQTGAP